jgi:AraC family transcriptional regulator
MFGINGLATISSNGGKVRIGVGNLLARHRFRYLRHSAGGLGICHDDPETTPPAKLRYDACLTVDEEFAPRGDIGVQTVVGGAYAMTTHTGPYNQIGRTYAEFLGQWIPRSGHGLRNAPCFEVYVNDPGSTPPEELLTDIYAPLQDLELILK